jgi:hypothetical protein
MTKALVAAPFIPISKFPHSHRGAQGVIYADMLRARGLDVTCNMSLDLYHEDFNLYDELYVYHGNDWTGHLNIFGGLQNFPYAHNFENFTRFRGKVYSLAVPFPDYHGMLHHKMSLVNAAGKPMQDEWKRADWDNLKRMQDTAVTVVHPNLTGNLILGDSHSICLYRPGWTVQSIPFKTLYGALSIGLENMLPSAYEGSWNIQKLDLYFGNIDVRHHLGRQEDPVESTRILAMSYIEQADNLSVRHGVETKIYELLPIENESRTIPKTGWYEGAPYHGDWSLRNELRLVFRDVLDTHTDGRWVHWTDHLLNEKGELDFKKMERPKSVHLSRDAYPHWQGRDWNGPDDTLTGCMSDDEEI